MKKLSSAATEGWPSSEATSAAISGLHVRRPGAARRRLRAARFGSRFSADGAGRADLSSLPLAVIGSSATLTNCAGNHVVGQPRGEKLAQIGGGQPGVAGRRRRRRRASGRRRCAPAHHGAGFDARIAVEAGDDFAGLDAIAANFHLVVEPAQERDLAVGQQPRTVAGAIDAQRRPGRGRIGDEAAGRQFGQVPIAAADQGAGQAEFAGFAGWHRTQVRRRGSARSRC